MRSDSNRPLVESHTVLQGAGWNPKHALSPTLVEDMIEALPYSIAALDRRGIIVSTNEAWRRFARENGAPTLAESSIGLDYLEVCRRATGPFAEGAFQSMRGIQAVLDGTHPLFTLEYPCPSLTEQRWFLMLVTPLPVEQGGVIVSHIQLPRPQTEKEHARMFTAEAEARAKAEATATTLSHLQMVTDAVITHRKLPELESAVMERIQQVMTVDYVWIMLTTEDGRELALHVARGGHIEDSAEARVPIDQGLMGRVATSREPVVANDLKAGDIFQSEIIQSEMIERGEMRSFAGVPLLVADRLVGVLSISTKKPRHFTPEDVNFLRLVSDRIALALEYVRLDAITQRIHSEAEERAAQLAGVVAAISDPLFVFDHEGNILLQNAADRALVGLASGVPDVRTIAQRASMVPLSDLQGAPLPITERPSTRILYGETLQGEQALDMLIRRRDGGATIVSASGSPIRDAQGNIVGGVVIIRDVTERRNMERALDERAKQLAEVVEAIRDPLFVFDREGNILFQNAADRIFLGLAPHAPSPRTIQERGKTLRLSDLQGHLLPKKEWPVFRVLRGDTLQGSQMMDLLFHTVDGREVITNVSGGPIRDAQGQIIGGMLVMRDVTERRVMERRTRELLEALLAMAETLVAPEARAVDTPGTNLVARRLAELTRNALGCERISITALETKELWVRAIVRLGWPPDEELRWYREARQYRLADVMPDASITRLRTGEVVLVERPIPWSTVPVPGKPRILIAPLLSGSELIGALSLDFGDKPHTYTADEMAVASAVSQFVALVLERDRLLHEREEAIANELATRQVKGRMDDFLAMATHDLRSPVAVAKLATQDARRRIERQIAAIAGTEAAAALPIATIQTNLNMIEDSMNRLVRLIDRLLDVSRVRAGKLDLRREPCDLRHIVHQIVEEQRLLAPQRVLRLRLPSRAVIALVDADRISQVVTNFLTNALRYASDQSPIDITLRITGGQARLSVRDRGPGIRPEEQAGIWERFQQAEQGKAKAARSGGLGIGLYISREIIHLHGGQTGMRSVPGKGSTFWFTLPLDQDAGDADRPTSTTPAR